MSNILEITTENCTGCSACKEICSMNAIEMREEDEGFLIPRISEKECVRCGKCVSVCQIYNNTSSNDNNKIAYAVRFNDNIREKAASGAYFQALARHYIERGGYVCGCVLDDMKVKHIVSNTYSDIERMADSKYVQSDMGKCFSEIGKLLVDKIEVLFSGTSCQVVGLINYLNREKISTKTLLTIDFFCHGVPSPKIWKEYISYYEKKKKVKLIDYRWRCKEYGWGEVARGANHLNSAIYGLDNKKKIDRSILARKWRHIFFSNIVLRKCCYECKYCTINKPADITMGDFWKLNTVLPSFNDNKGTSLVIIHKEKNIDKVENIDGLVYKRVDPNLAIQGQINAYRPSEVNQRRAEFWNDYRTNGFDYVMKKFFMSPSRIIKDHIKYILFKLKIGNL